MPERKNKRCKCGRIIHTIYKHCYDKCEYCRNNKVKSSVNMKYVSNIEPKTENKTHKEYMSIKLTINLELTKNDKESLFYDGGK